MYFVFTNNSMPRWFKDISLKPINIKKYLTFFYLYQWFLLWLPVRVNCIIRTLYVTFDYWHPVSRKASVIIFYFNWEYDLTSMPIVAKCQPLQKTYWKWMLPFQGLRWVQNQSKWKSCKITKIRLLKAILHLAFLHESMD